MLRFVKKYVLKWYCENWEKKRFGKLNLFFYWGDLMITTKDVSDRESGRTILEQKNFVYGMCRTCKFYDKGCTKKRIIRICALKGLKNKD